MTTCRGASKTAVPIEPLVGAVAPAFMIAPEPPVIELASLVLASIWVLEWLTRSQPALYSSCNWVIFIKPEVPTKLETTPIVPRKPLVFIYEAASEDSDG